MDNTTILGTLTLNEALIAKDPETGQLIAIPKGAVVHVEIFNDASHETSEAEVQQCNNYVGGRPNVHLIDPRNL